MGIKHFAITDLETIHMALNKYAKEMVVIEEGDEREKGRAKHLADVFGNMNGDVSLVPTSINDTVCVLLKEWPEQMRLALLQRMKAIRQASELVEMSDGMQRELDKTKAAYDYLCNVR